MLCFLSMPLPSKTFLIQISILIIALSGTCTYSKYRGKDYSARAGLMLTILITLLLYIIFVATISEIRIWLSLSTFFICGYEWFLVYKVSSVIEFMKQEEHVDNFQGGLYANLLIFKAKLDFFAGIIAAAYRKCCVKKKPKDNTEI